MTTTAPRRPGRPRGAQQDPIERRAALLAAAETAITVHGANVSMEQIAAAAGVSKATLYDNFEGKAGLTEALLDRYGIRILTMFAASMATPMTAEQVVRGAIETFVHQIETQPEIYRFVLLHEDGAEVLADVAAPVAALVASELDRQGLDPSSADALAHASLGAVFTATEWWCAQRHLDRDAFVDVLVGFVWAGLTAAGLRPGDEPVDITPAAKAINAAIDQASHPT